MYNEHLYACPAAQLGALISTYLLLMQLYSCSSYLCQHAPHYANAKKLLKQMELIINYMPSSKKESGHTEISQQVPALRMLTSFIFAYLFFHPTAVDIETLEITITKIYIRNVTAFNWTHLNFRSSYPKGDSRANACYGKFSQFICARFYFSIYSICLFSLHCVFIAVQTIS